MTPLPRRNVSGVTERDLGSALGTLFRAYLREVDLAVSATLGTPRAYLVLSVVAGGDCANQAAIAARLGLDRTALTHLVDDLEARGLVERSPDPADRRARRVALTQRGVEVHGELAGRVRLVERRLLGALTGTEGAELRRLLDRAAVAVEQGGPDDTCTIADDLEVFA